MSTLGELQIKQIKEQAAPDFGSLNSGNLSAEPAIDYNAYQEPPVPDISGLEVPDLQMTESETQAQGFNEQMQALNTQLLGESAYRGGLENERGLPGMIQTQTDLANQIRTLQNEAQAIPLQIQQESEGQGRTAGGVAPLQTGRLRENAIKALSTSALLQATNNNILTAQTLVDRAVAQKYDPIRERINVAKANLELILSSPKYSLEDKNRAEKQKRLQEKLEKETATKEAEEKAIMSVALQAAQAGIDASILDKIRNAESELEATRIAQEAGLYKPAPGGGFTLSEGQKRYDDQGNLIADNPKQAEELTEMEMLNIEAKKLDIQQKLKDLSKPGGLDNQTISQVDRISTSFDNSPIVKNFNEVQNKKLSIDAIVDNGVGGPADLALVFEFMKALDPTSVVRESEYDTAATSGNIFKGWAAKFNGYFKAEGGILPEEVKAEFKRITADKFDIIRRQYGNLRDEKARLINQKTGTADGIDYLIDYDFTSRPEAPQNIEEFITGANAEQLDALEYFKTTYPDITDDDLFDLILEQQGFSTVGGDTNKALSKVQTVPEGSKGGQCGRFVNKITGLGLGDSYQSKLAKMDPSIKEPKPGMVFVMPYGSTGHTGFVLGVRGDKVIVKDSNYSLDEKVKVHEIPKSKITGLTYA